MNVDSGFKINPIFNYLLKLASPLLMIFNICVDFFFHDIKNDTNYINFYRLFIYAM